MKARWKTPHHQLIDITPGELFEHGGELYLRLSHRNDIGNIGCARIANGGILYVTPESKVMYVSGAVLGDGA